MVDLHAELLALIQAVREETTPEDALALKEVLREMYEQPFYRAGNKDYEAWLTQVVAWLLPRVNARQVRFETELARRWAASLAVISNRHWESEAGAAQDETAALAAAREAPHED